MEPPRIFYIGSLSIIAILVPEAVLRGKIWTAGSSWRCQRYRASQNLRRLLRLGCNWNFCDPCGARGTMHISFNSEECKFNKRLIDDGGHLIYRRDMRSAKGHEPRQRFDLGFIMFMIEMSPLRTTAHVRQTILGIHCKGHK